MKHVKKSLVTLREERGLTQVKVARMLGISAPAYCRKEKGVRPLFATELQHLAKIFGVSLDDIALTVSDLSDVATNDDSRNQIPRA